MTEQTHILYLDTDPLLLEITKHFLEQEGGWKVTTAVSAGEAIHQLSENPFDAIVSEYELEEMNGIELLKHLREKGDTTPFIIFTGKGREEVVIEALNNGADFYLQKGGHPSAQFAELSHIIQVAISRRQTESALLRKNDELIHQDHIIQESEKQFESLFMHMIEGAVLHDLTYTPQGDPDDYIIVKTNPAFERQLGITREAVIGKTSREAYGVSDPPYLDVYARVALTGKPEIFETYYQPMEKYFSISVYCPYKGSFATIFEDITDQKNKEFSLLRKNEELQAAFEEIASTEEELRSNLNEITRQESIIRINEERLVMAQEIGHVGSWEYSLDTGQIWGSAEGFRIYGFPPIAGDIDIEKIEACIPEREMVHQALEDLISRGQAYNLEFTITPADGSPSKIIHSIAKIERDDEGNPLKVRGVIQDISDLKQKEKDLRESSTYLENLITSANSPIIVWDSAFRITRTNRAFELLSGRNSEQMLGQSLEILFPPSQVDRSMRLIRTTLDGVRWQTVEIEIQHVNGTIRTVVWNSSTIYSADGVYPVATIAQGQDVTDQKRLEQERDVALEQIKQNLAQLSILNDEIRNPLTVISLITEAIDDKKIAEQIISQSHRIDEMVRQLDQRWIESEKVLGFLRRHYQLSFDQREIHQRTEDSDTILPHGATGYSSILVQEAQAELYIILDSIDALVYVADMQTHELLFMNWKGRSLFENTIGKKCYEILHQSQHGECPFCTNSVLVDQNGPTGVYQWEFHSPKNGRWYDCRDQAIRWVDGRIVRLEIATDITERKHAEEALREKTEEIDQFFTNSLDLFCIADTDGYFRQLNPEWEHTLGYTLAELEGCRFLDFVHPDDLSATLDAIADLDNKKEVLNFTNRYRHKDGSYRWIEWRSSPNSQNNRIYAAALDVTGRKQMEGALKESEERFRSLLQHIPSISVQGYNMDGTTQYWNDASETLYGYAADEAIGKNLVDLVIPPEMQEDVRSAMNYMAETGQPIPASELVLMKKDRSRITVFSSHAIIKKANGELELFCIDIDLTELKKIEEQNRDLSLTLSESEEKYRSLIENTYDIIYTLDNEGIFTYNSPNWTLLLGHPIDQVTGQSFKKFVHPDDIPGCMVFLQSVLKTGERKDGIEYRVQHANGTWFWHTTSAVPMKDKQGRVIGFYGIAHDITDRKKTEEALFESNKKLQLLNGLTRHDINNQVSALQLLLNLALNSSDLIKIKDYVAQSLDAGDHIERSIGFTREYEDFGIISSGWQQIHHVIESAKADISNGNVTIQNQVSVDLEVYADPIIRKVFATLMENAIRHGGGITCIRFSVGESIDSHIITCQDDGVGIPPDEKDQIFNHGYGKHTGIGLFLAREILSITGLSIRECGEDGKGARFEILVPEGKWRANTRLR